jgi:ABC-type glycerol-3-phosphate transport system permease component
MRVYNLKRPLTLMAPAAGFHLDQKHAYGAQLGLTVFQAQFKVDYALLMAAVVFVTVPSVWLFFFG